MIESDSQLKVFLYWSLMHRIRLIVESRSLLQLIMTRCLSKKKGSLQAVISSTPGQGQESKIDSDSGIGYLCNFNFDTLSILWAHFYFFSLAICQELHSSQMRLWFRFTTDRASDGILLAQIAQMEIKLSYSRYLFSPSVTDYVMEAKTINTVVLYCKM